MIIFCNDTVIPYATYYDKEFLDSIRSKLHISFSRQDKRNELLAIRNSKNTKTNLANK